jgi:mRNA interferase RelE/StbE
LAFNITYHQQVRDDLAPLNEKVKQRLRRAIESRLLVEPQSYGQPLRGTLKGYWKLRVGDYRIVFKVIENDIKVLGICHRKDVYEKIQRRKEEVT